MQWGAIRRLIPYTRQAAGIARRYFVTNGFDGALTMLGLMVGFAVSEDVSLPMAITACLGAAIALCMSGLSSAYLSETAERKRELNQLEAALLTDLSNSDHARASSVVPVMVALVNGLSPLLISFMVMTPLWLATLGMALPLSPFIMAMGVALFILFLLGVMLGRLSQEFWLWTGLRTLVIGGITVGVIYLFRG